MNAGNRSRVLLIEDGALEATVLIEAAERAAPGRFEFAIVATLDGALRKLGRASTDCIVLDLELSGAATPAAVATLRARAPATPLVALAAMGNAGLARAAIRDGADDCLEKSAFDARQLVRTLELALERGAARQRLLEIARRDPLTGLANRAQLDESLTAACARAARSGRLLGLLYLDLDGFKLANDALGHEAGDALLKAIAARFAGQLRAGDLLARPGGDEFAVVLENLPSAECAARVARKLIATLEAPLIVGHEALRIGASVGIAFRPTDGESPAALLRAADRAMYAAKRRGGSRIGCSARLIDPEPAHPAPAVAVAYA